MIMIFAYLATRLKHRDHGLDGELDLAYFVLIACCNLQSGTFWDFPPFERSEAVEVSQRR